MKPDERPKPDPLKQDYRTLPPPIALEDVVESVDTHTVPDPEGGQNAAQRLVLRPDV